LYRAQRARRRLAWPEPFFARRIDDERREVTLFRDCNSHVVNLDEYVRRRDGFRFTGGNIHTDPSSFFAVGTYAEVTAAGGGELFLQYVDGTGMYADNAGALPIATPGSLRWRH
jgi:hypothetical protein